VDSEPQTTPTTFEQAYERLRQSVEELEAGPLALEEAIARYEEGMRLARLCNEMLDRAELRLQVVLREPGSGGAES
jgi:exodeoxyribonuclease VII small subunit